MRRACLVVAAAVLVAGGSACSEDPDPRVAPSDPPSSAVSTTPASGPVEPTLPPEAEGDDAAAAEAFIEYFWAMVKYAETTGETADLSALALESCDACRGGSDSIREVHDSGGEFTGGGVTVISVKAVRISGDRVAFGLTAELDFESQVVRIPGESPKRYEGGRGTYQFILHHEDGAWRVARWDAMT